MRTGLASKFTASSRILIFTRYEFWGWERILSLIDGLLLLYLLPNKFKIGLKIRLDSAMYPIINFYSVEILFTRQYIE